MLQPQPSHAGFFYKLQTEWRHLHKCDTSLHCCVFLGDRGVLMNKVSCTGDVEKASSGYICFSFTNNHPNNLVRPKKTRSQIEACTALLGYLVWTQSNLHRAHQQIKTIFLTRQCGTLTRLAGKRPGSVNHDDAQIIHSLIAKNVFMPWRGKTNSVGNWSCGIEAEGRLCVHSGTDLFPVHSGLGVSNTKYWSSPLLLLNSVDSQFLVFSHKYHRDSLSGSLLLSAELTAKYEVRASPG